MKTGIKKTSGLQIKDFAVKFEGISKSGEFEGYASVFGVTDLAREVVAPGAFAETLAELKASGRRLPALWNHKSDEPLGFYTDLTEDERGLHVRGKLLTGKVSKADEIAALVDEGAVSGLSIGYWVQDESYNSDTRITTLIKLKLREISLVTFPCNEDARIESIKCKLANGTFPSIPEFEKLLRDAGFSRSVATRITAKGYATAIDQSESDHNGAALKALQDLHARISN